MSGPVTIKSLHFASPPFEVEPDHRLRALGRLDDLAEKRGPVRALRIQRGVSVFGFVLMTSVSVAALVRLGAVVEGSASGALAFAMVTALVVAPIVGHGRWVLFVLRVKTRFG